MILFYLNNKNQKQAKFIRYLFRSYTGQKQIQPTSRFSTNHKLHEKASTIVFAGFIRGEGLIYQYCKEKNKNFLYIDHAYINRGYNSKNPDEEWMRITYNAFTWNKNEIESNDRWNQYFAKSYSLSPWKSSQGKKILVLPPSESTKYLFPESVEWTNKAIEEVRKRLNAPVVIREKPFQVEVNPTTNFPSSSLVFEYDKPIEAELLDAKIIISFSSGVPVMGTILGIPCYCSDKAAAYPMNINLNYLNNPPEPDRQTWLNQLVYHQYKTTEMISGSVWNVLKKYEPKFK
jgi:hypothetical protein